jgi:RES domain-containing protein
MQAWRLTRAGFLDQVLSGQGAKKYGGRWNSKGIAMVYASESLELALLEALVHLDPDLVPKDIYQVCFEIDEAFITPYAGPLPSAWDRRPPYQSGVQVFGDRWIRERSSVGLKVPASVLPKRYNILLNPAHKDFGQVHEISRDPLPWPTRVIDYLKSVRRVGVRRTRRAKRPK